MTRTSSGRPRLDALAQSWSMRGQEGGERLAGARGRRDEGVFATPDGAPAFKLRFVGSLNRLAHQVWRT
jgi:hypothetical protein